MGGFRIKWISDSIGLLYEIIMIRVLYIVVCYARVCMCVCVCVCMYVRGCWCARRGIFLRDVSSGIRL